MNYTMKSGILYTGQTILFRLKGAFCGPERSILRPDGTLALLTQIRNLDPPEGKSGHVRCREYLVSDSEGNTCALAKPDYADGSDPDINGWPLYGIPRVDHARFFYQNSEYLLKMQNSQNYFLSDPSGSPIVQILHKGLAGGWNIETTSQIPPEMICAIFVFCRYIERENEFLVV